MEIKKASSEDIPEIVDLFHLVFGPRRDLEDWIRMYGRTPAGEAASYILRADDGEVVGHLGAIPNLYYCGDRSARGALLVDYMVHPHWAGQGLGSRLERAVHESIGEEYDFSFGFSNRKSVSVSTKAGMGLLGRTPVYVRFPRKRRRRRMNARPMLPNNPSPATNDLIWEDDFIPRLELGGGRLRRIDLGGNEPDFEGLVKGPQLWHRSRDAASLGWRYEQRPEGPYYLFGLEAREEGVGYEGYIILARRRILDRDAGVIADIWVEDGGREAARLLLSAAVDILSLQGVEVINCLFRGSSDITSSLRRLGFIRLPQRIFPNQLNLNLKAYESSEAGVKEDLDTWYFTWGDTDLV
jgi:GNAT superfamily N-acetyltransferase